MKWYNLYQYQFSSSFYHKDHINLVLLLMEVKYYNIFYRKKELQISLKKRRTVKLEHKVTEKMYLYSSCSNVEVGTHQGKLFNKKWFIFIVSKNSFNFNLFVRLAFFNVT